MIDTVTVYNSIDNNIKRINLGKYDRVKVMFVFLMSSLKLLQLNNLFIYAIETFDHFDNLFATFNNFWIPVIGKE